MKHPAMTDDITQTQTNLFGIFPITDLTKIQALVLFTGGGSPGAVKTYHNSFQFINQQKLQKFKKLVCTGKKEIVLINLHKTYPNSADRPPHKTYPNYSADI